MARSRFARDVSDLDVFQIAYGLAMDVYQISKTWPLEEKFALATQIRRSSRSVCSNLAEAWRKREYKRDFELRISNAHSECEETKTWLSFARDCGYISSEQHDGLKGKAASVSAMLYKMMIQSDLWCRTNRKD
jgi:four helix bundle protein